MKKEKPQIKTVIFDLGNVLVNFNAIKSGKRFAKHCNVPFEKVWEHFFISKTEKAYTRGKLTSRQFYKFSCQALDVPVDYKTFAHYWNDIFWENKGMDALLRDLKKNYPLYLISNTNELHFSHLKKKFKILRHFKKLFPSHEVGHRKPEPQIYKKVLKKIGYKPQDTVFVDDVVKFVEGARAVGMHAVQFRTPQGLKRDLRRLGVKIS